MGEKRNVGKSERKRPIKRPRHRWVDNIKMNLGEVEWGLLTGLVWLNLWPLKYCLAL
jgi:hypothetical protein